MTTASATPSRGTRAVLVGLGVTLAMMTVAVWLKTRCPVPGASAEQLYLQWCYSDVPPLYFTERLHEGAVPYLDAAVEYPVLTGLWMWLAALPVTTVGGFLWATVVLLVAGAVATTVLLVREVGLVRSLAFAAAPTLALSGAVNWDLPAVALATAGVVAHRRGRDGLAGTMLGLGTAAKLFPGLLLVVLVPAAWRERGRSAGLVTVLTAAVAWWAVNAPIALAAPDGWLEFVRLNRERGADWDSLYTLLGHLGGPDLATDTVNLVSAAAFAVATVALLAHAQRRVDPSRWHELALPLVIAFLLANKVYSPQFSLWLLPLFAFAFPGWGWLATFAVTDLAVTAFRFPYLAGFLDPPLEGAIGYGPFGTAVGARAVVLVAIAVVAARRAARPVIQHRGEPEPAGAGSVP